MKKIEKINYNNLTKLRPNYNGTQIPLKGELKVTFKVANHKHTVSIAVTEAVDEFILGINFLSEQCCL